MAFHLEEDAFHINRDTSFPLIRVDLLLGLMIAVMMIVRVEGGKWWEKNVYLPQKNACYFTRCRCVDGNKEQSSTLPL